MAEKRKGKKRKEDFPNNEEQPEKPAKEEYAVAKWLKKNIPHKKTKFLCHYVQYFTGAKAIDALLESHFTVPKKEGDETLFKTRADVIQFLDVMLRHKFFHRAKKVPVSEEELAARKKKKKGEKDSEKKDKDSKKYVDDAESSHAEGKSDDKSDAKSVKEKKKHKIRLEMHFDQIFADGLDAYVWIYDPIPFYYWVLGTLLVLSAIAVCLFPLWPPDVRKGVYYISIAAAGFLCLIVALTVFRLIVFCILWSLTFGKHHLWLLPNLTEDVGFFASFWPLYQYEYKGKEAEKSGRKKKKKKEKDSDNEQEDDYDRQDDDNLSMNRYIRARDLDDKKDFDNDDTDPKTSEGERNSPSESESEHSSQKSQTGRDFEMVEKEEVENSS
ncbi:UNVERIFIED_CONTAM: hypothetical protein PYX00_010375 [Menopon gallinae]|uniref:Translocation protein SEC62 n=1 Tax=Menopon gallinae TaxID=328185 RepID=A0AAW2HFE2_9NEOP